MAGLWPRTGNVTVTNGSKTITGFGTKWKTGILPIQKGHAFYGPDGVANEVDTVVSDTEILLVEAYRGGTMANQPYKIDITRTSTISQFSAELSSLVGKYRTWFDSMMTWLTGSGDVSILNPDTGATTTVPSWKKVASEGEGQAARAKAEADKAAASAAQAGSIVEASALPLPDVWAPLSDSLRMITGYGREVKVGDDVVARMVNFSRSTTATYIGKDGQLKTAAANEPRFEKEGLLIEGQSTNTLQNSTAPNTTYQVTKTEDVTAPDGVSVASTFTNTQAANYIRFGVIVTGANTATITGSVWIKAVSGSGQLTAGVDDRGTITITPTSEWVRYSFTRSGEAASSNIIDIRFVAGHNDLKIAVWGAQREVGPIATSLIPTNGPAVTRAADVCWIDKNNLPTGGFSVAVNFESRCVSVNPANSDYSKIALLSTSVSNSSIKLACGKDTANGITTGAYGWAKNTAGAITYFTGSPSVQIPRYQGCMKLAVSSIRCRFGVNDEFVSAAGLPRGFDPTDILLGAYRISGSAYGVQHIRNLRIWHLDLTDDQLKAVA